MKPCAVISTAIKLAFALAFAPIVAQAASCYETTFESASFTVCEANPASDDIRLFLNDEYGNRLAAFTRIDAELAAEDQALIFAMNAGMYHPDRRPVGLYIENNETRTRIVTRDGPGNFGLLPNGILCLGDGFATILESRAFAESPPNCRFATQSGPMLVIDGNLHPRLIPNSPSKFRRNGVGVRDNGMLVAAISNEIVNFHVFARLFRDGLQTPNALYMDGNISRLYAPELGRHDPGFPMGPMLGVVGPAD